MARSAAKQRWTPSAPDPFAATAFEDLTRLAADLMGTPMAAISVLTCTGGHLKAAIGIAGASARQTPSQGGRHRRRRRRAAAAAASASLERPGAVEAPWPAEERTMHDCRRS
jgi:hypothetical protein